MAYVIEDIPVDPVAALPEAPLNPAGEPYHYAMVFDGRTAIAYADSCTELCGILIDGYDNIPDEDLSEQSIQRVLYAVAAQTRLQAEILADADLSELSPSDLALLTASRDTPPAFDTWGPDVPLVLVDAFYAPYTDTARPRGVPRGGGEPDSNIIWLGWADEYEFLRSLAAAGVIQLFEHDYSTESPGSELGTEPA